MRVCVIIPTWLRAEWLGRCLDGVALQSRRPDEVLVVGRDDDFDAEEVVRLHAPLLSGARWIGGAPAGHVGPVLLGLSCTDADLVAILDDDAVPEDGWLAALIAHFSDERVACVGGYVYTSGSTEMARIKHDAGRVRWYGQHIGNVGSISDGPARDVDGVMEGNCAWRRPVLASLEFEPRLQVDDAIMYGLDLCLQAAERGWRVRYEPRARVTHYAAPRDDSLPRGDDRRSRNYSRSYTIVAMRHLRGPRRLAFVLWWVLVGERESYGVFGALFDRIKGREDAFAKLAVSLRGKRDGFREWRAA